MNREQRDAIAAAIRDAEDGTTSRIAVRVVLDKTVDAFGRAKHEFERAGLHRHEAENAALILIAPKARRFAILGDRALHERVGDDFWNELVKKSQPYFARGQLFEGILYAVDRIGEAVHEHFLEAAK
jgi:uncharacterized membrane protein